MKEFAQFEFYSPLAQQTNRLCSDYTVYVHKYKNGNICVKGYDGASPEPYFYIRSVSENKLYAILKARVPLYNSSGCKMVAYIDEDDGVITIFK